MHKQMKKSKLYAIYHSAIESAEVAPYTHQEIVVEAYENLGFVLNLSGEIEKANKYFQKALEMTIDEYSEQSDKAFYLYGKMALVFQSQGNFSKAFYYSEKALQVGLQVFPRDSKEVTRDYSQLRAIL